MSGNGTKPRALMNASELLAAIEADEARARRTEEREQIEDLRAQLAAANAKLDKLTAPPPLLRREMSPSEKSAYIQAHGLTEYMKLPMQRT